MMMPTAKGCEGYGNGTNIWAFSSRRELIQRFPVSPEKNSPPNCLCVSACDLGDEESHSLISFCRSLLEVGRNAMEPRASTRNMRAVAAYRGCGRCDDR